MMWKNLFDIVALSGLSTAEALLFVLKLGSRFLLKIAMIKILSP